MCELRSTNPDRTPRDFFSAKSNMEAKLQAFLSSLDKQTLDAIRGLAKVDRSAQDKALAGVDAKTRDALRVILDSQ